MSTLSKFAKSIFSNDCSQDAYITNIVNRVVNRAEGELDNFHKAVAASDHAHSNKQIQDIVRFAYFIVEETPSPIMMCDKDGIITYVNQAFCTLLNTSKHMVVSKPVGSIIGTNSISEWDRHWDNITAGEKSTCYLSIKTLRSPVRAIEVMSSMVEIEGRDVVVSFITDRTEAQKIQDAIYSPSRYIEAIVQQSQCLTIMIDKDMEIITASKAWLDLINKHKSLIVGKNIRSMDHCTDHDIHMIRRALTGETVVSNKDVIMDNNNSPRYVKKTILPWYNKKKIAGAIVVQEIITDRIVLEKNAHKQGIMFHAIFNSIQRPITLLDADGRIIEINQHMMDRCNISHSDAIGKYLWEVCCYCDRDPRLIKKKKKSIARASRGDNVDFTWEMPSNNNGETTTLKCFLRPLLGSDSSKIEFIVHDLCIY